MWILRKAHIGINTKPPFAAWVNPALAAPFTLPPEAALQKVIHALESANPKTALSRHVLRIYSGVYAAYYPHAY